MDMTDENCSPVIVTNGAYPVRCTEEVLLPFILEASQQAAMDSQLPPDSHSVPSALPELRLVLLGRKGAGKSAAGNTILGGVGCFESGKPTEECVKRRADVAGRRVTVVDTPGWEWYYPLNSTPNWVRRETLRSVSLCPSGPHAVLLVVRSCSSITVDYIGEIEEHLGPLGKGVWEHTMLLFTRGDELGLASMEQRISTSGPGLQRLLQKCGNRYHVVNNRSKGDGTQVRELMRKLEEMVEGKKDGSSHLKMDNTALVDLEADGKRRARERRKKQRQMEAQLQRGTIKAMLMSDGLQGSELDAHQSFSKAPQHLPEVRLVLLGERETGKSSAGNAILGKMVFFQAGAVTEECVRQQAEVDMRLVTVVDTPGWEGGVAGATPERVKREIACSVALCPPGPHALLLALRVDTLVRAAHVREHLELLGEGVWRHTILLFTHGDQLREGVDIEQHVQGGGRDLQGLLEKCRGRYHVISSADGGGRGEVTELLQKVEKMAAMNRCEAFSGLVQEVRDLSRHRNEKFNQRLKDMGDKMLRQEDELKNMRESEVKRITWFFDRKKKVKSPGKANIQREEEEEEDSRMDDERKNDIGYLEERMGWLTEDKEREIQDLSIENERICAALNQSRGERHDATLNLELRERESEELIERIDEQQLKLLDLERAVVENEHERKQREDTIKATKLEWMSEVKKLEESIELQKKEKAEWMENIASLKADMDETKRRHDDILERKEQEKDREMAEMEEKLKSEMEIKLLEKDKEREEMREKASEEKQIILDNAKQYEKAMQRKVEEMKLRHHKEIEREMHEREMEIKGIQLQHQEEMARKICEIEKMMETMKVQHQEEIDQRLKDNKEDRERVKQQHDNEIKDTQQERLREVAELKEQFAKETEEQRQAKKREMAELEQRYLAHTEGNMLENEKEKETIHLNHKKDMAQKMQEKENELEVLKLHHREEMARKKKEMEELVETRSAGHQEEMDRTVKEKKEDVERVQQQCSDKIRDIEQERQREMKELKQQFAETFEKQLEEGQRQIRELGQKHRAQTEEKVLENEKEKEVMKENHEKYILQKLQQRDGLIEELNRQHMNEIKELMQESDQEKETLVMNLKEEMEQILEGKEKETEEMKLNVREMKEELQQKEEKEMEHLNFKQVMEQRLEERERDTEVMKQHSKELEQQLRQTEEERERDHMNHRKQMGQKLQEQDRVVEKLNQHIKDIDEILQRKDEERGETVLTQKKEAEQRLRDRERETEEMKRELLNDAERKLNEKESEIESVKQQAESRERRWREERRKKDEAGERELNRLLELIDEETKETAQARRLLAERDGQIDEARKTLANYSKEIEELSESNEKQTCSIVEMRRRHAEQEREKDAEMMERLQGKEEELRQRDGENEREIVRLRLTIEQTKSELKELTHRMEKEMTSMILEYEKEAARRNENVEAIAEERDRAARRSEEVSEKYEESRRRVEEQKEQNEKMRKETERLEMKCAELKMESEEEVRKHLGGYEEQVKSAEAQMQRVLKERDVEVGGLREENDKLQVELERMKEGHGEAERQKNDMRECFQKESELRMKEEEFLKRENKVGEREQLLSRRGNELDAKETELAGKEVKLESKEEELSKREASLGKRQKEQEEKEKHEQEVSTRAQNTEKRERELESLLRALEGRQKELNCHGQDLQEKVRGLKDRERHLRNEEQELLGWKSELQVRNERVNSTTQQLDEMGRDLALLKEELHTKESNLKASLKKLGKWEQDLKEREEGLRKRERRDLENAQDEVGDREADPFGQTAAAESSEDDLNLMYREVSERRDKGRGRESDRGEKETEDQKMEPASSAAERNNCHLETLKEIETAEPERMWKGQKVVRDVSSNLPGSDLRAVVLGESWSPRSPAGVTILCGEPSKPDGSTFRHWRGQVAGRRLAVAEPLGLRWRDGPDPTNATQRTSVLDGVSWCRPGPHAVLLLMPAFLTCTRKYRRAVEGHVGLLGEGIWRRTLVLFTWGEMLGESAEQHILRNGELARLVERCGGRYHVLSNRRSTSLIQGLLEKMEDMVAVNSGEL